MDKQAVYHVDNTACFVYKIIFLCQMHVLKLSTLDYMPFFRNVNPERLFQSCDNSRGICDILRVYRHE